MKTIRMISMTAALLLFFVACKKEEKTEKAEEAKAPVKEAPAPAKETPPPAPAIEVPTPAAPEAGAQSASLEKDILGKWVLEGDNPAGDEFESLEFLLAGEIVYATGVKGTYELSAERSTVTLTHPEEDESLELDLKLIDDLLNLSKGGQSIILKKQK